MKMNTDPNKPLIDPPAYKNFLKQKPKELQSWQIDKCAQEQEEKQGLDFADKIINKFKPKELECELNKEQKDWLLDVLNTKSDNALKVILINGLISKLITQQRTELLEEIEKILKHGCESCWGDLHEGCKCDFERIEKFRELLQSLKNTNLLNKK